jgi:hypothetical protein
MPAPKPFFHLPRTAAKAKARSRPLRQARASNPSPPAAGSSRQHWELLVIDQEPIRQSATLAYRQANDRLAELRGAIERFSTTDQPAFGGWMAACFGALLTQLREISEQIAEKAPLLEAVEIMAFLSRCSPHEAYRRVLQTKHAAEAFAAKHTTAAEQAGEEEFPFDDEEETPLDDFFAEVEEMFGIPKPSGARIPPPPPPGPDPRARSSRPGRRRRAQHPAEEPASPEQRTLGQRVKTAYRAVVRRLHPDLNPHLSGYGQQLWHDAQSAYEKGDLEVLETILAVSELESGGELPVGSGIGGLLELTRRLAASIRKLERQLRALKKNPAWNFTGLVSRGALEQSVGARLRRDVEQAKADLEALEEELAFYSQPPARRSKAAPKKESKPSSKARKQK